MSYRTFASTVQSGVGWLGDLPSHWAVVPAKALFSLRTEKALPDDVHLTPSQKYGVLPQAEYMEITGSRVVLNLTDSGQMKHVEPNDFVSHLRSFQGGLELSRIRGKVSGAYTVLKPRSDQNPEFWKYVLKSDTYIQALQTTTDQLRDGQSIRLKEFAQIPLPLVPRVEQDAIVEFLDREIAQIDAAVEKQRKLSTLLLERRQSLINAAVRFGLRSEEVSEFSTISWIGSYSKRFSIQRLKHNTYLKARVGWKGLTSDEFQLDSFAYLVTGSDFRGKYVKWEDCYQVDESRYLDDPFIHLADGDLLVTKDGSIGKLALVSGLDKPACLNSGVFLMRPKHSYTNSYMFWLLSSDIFREFVQLTSYGSTIQHLYQNVFENFSYPLPNLSEQLEIVGYLEEKTDQIDVMIEKSEKLVEVLSQRKLSLVGAAVTGKINLRGIQKLG